LNECYTKSAVFGFRKEIVKVWEKYIIINYLIIYRKHIDNDGYKDIVTLFNTISFIIRKYKELDGCSCTPKLITYCENYKKELIEFQREVNE
jgi:hypothetical protein